MPVPTPAENIRLKADARFASVVVRATAGSKHTPHEHIAKPDKKPRMICQASPVAAARKTHSDGAKTKQPIRTGRIPILRANKPAGSVPATEPNIAAPFTSPIDRSLK